MDGKRSAASGDQAAPPPMDESWWSAVLDDKGWSGSEPARPVREHRSSAANSMTGSAQDWVWARELYESDETVNLSVVGYNRGGLLVEAKGLRGFVPVSHLVSVEQDDSDRARDEVMAQLVGLEICLKVIEFDPERGRLVFSQRAAQAGPGKRIELLENLQPGDCVHGRVTNITPFGVFVDLGGVEGLIHVSELSWGRVRHPSDVVCCGDDLEVQVLTVDRDQARIALSVKELLPDPWETVEEHYSVGETLTGQVTNVVKFGAFVCIDDGLEGLIHVSEMGDGGYLDPHDIVSDGEQVKVRVIHIDAQSRRLGLSLKDVDSAPTSERSDESLSQEAMSSC